MMNMNTHPASGRASALRVKFAPSTTIFKTRISPCRIAVRVEIKNLNVLGTTHPNEGVLGQ